MAEQSKPARKPKADPKPVAKAAVPAVALSAKEPAKLATAPVVAKPIAAPAPVAAPKAAAPAIASGPAAKPVVAKAPVPTKPRRRIAKALPKAAKAKPAPAPRPAIAKPATAAAPTTLVKKTKAFVAKVVSTPPVQKPLEGNKIMASTAETISPEKFIGDASAKFQGAFADIQTRSKTAIEKGAKFYEELGDFTKGNVEAVVASSRVAASAFESLGQDAAAYGKKSLEHAQATFKSATAVKSPTELFQLQSDYARAAFDAFVAEGSRFSEKVVKLAGEVAQPISSRVAVAAEKVKSAAL